jgi:hypothetical protein
MARLNLWQAPSFEEIEEAEALSEKTKASLSILR